MREFSLRNPFFAKEKNLEKKKGFFIILFSMRFLILFFSVALLCKVQLSCAESSPALELPWVTGPLLTPDPFTPGAGHQTYKPYVYWIKRKSVYDQNWDTQPTRHLDALVLEPIFKFGITKRTEIDIVPLAYYKYSQGPHSWELGDLTAFFALQLMEDNRLLNWGPLDVKLRLGVQFPIGKYDRLNSKKYKTDIGGYGSWDPSVALLMGKFFHFDSLHWLTTSWGFVYAFGTPVSIHGISSYGGTRETKGTVYPGNFWVGYLGMQATLTRHFALAFDLEIDHQNKTRFSGKSGGFAPRLPSSNLFIVAPAIEYNLSAREGIIFGPSITVAGRNAPQLISWVLSMNLRR